MAERVANGNVYLGTEKKEVSWILPLCQEMEGTDG